MALRGRGFEVLAKQQVPALASASEGDSQHRIQQPGL
jgi:hypothetical protein